MKTTISVVIFLLGFWVSVQQTPTSRLASPKQFKELLQVDHGLLIDVRTPEEYAAGHLDGAVNVDFLKSNFKERMDSLDREEPLLIYCRSGNRSAKAAKLLLEMGFQEVIDLEGGYQGWTAGLPKKDL